MASRAVGDPSNTKLVTLVKLISLVCYSLKPSDLCRSPVSPETSNAL